MSETSQWMLSYKLTLCAHTVRKHRIRQWSSKNKTKNQHSRRWVIISQGDPNISKPEHSRRLVTPSIFSFYELWCSSVFLWASNNCAKYQRDVPPDTLTFSTLTCTSHKDALVLSKTDRFEDEENRWRRGSTFLNRWRGNTCKCIKQLQQMWQQTTNRYSFRRCKRHEDKPINLSGSVSFSLPADRSS